MNARVSLIIALLFVLVPLCFASSGVVPADVDKAEVHAVLDAARSGAQLTANDLQLLKRAGVSLPGPQSGGELDESGGPDDFGHVWMDSDEPDGPVYGWVDITDIGTNIAPDLSDDDHEGPLPIGFTFPFYDQAYTSIYVQSNGTLNFDNTYISYGNGDLPYDTWSEVDDAFIAWNWTDLDPDSGNDGDIYYATTTIGDRQAFVVSFIGVAEYPWDNSAEHFTGQVILFDDGEILFQYDWFEPGFDTATSTLGIQNSDMTDFLQICTEGDAYLAEGLAVRIETADPNASLQGQVTDSDSGAPVEGAEVWVGPWMVTTGTNGGYLVETLYGGVTYDVTVIGPNYYHYSTTVDIAEGMNTLNIEIDPFPDPYPGSYEDNFEADGGILTGEGDWQHGTPTWWPDGAHSGTHAWTTIADGPYSNNQDAWLMFDETFLVNSDNAYLRYWHWFNYSAVGDGYNVQISTDGMETWQVLQPNMGYNDTDGIPANGYQPCFNNSGIGSGVWTEVIFDLSPYNGQQIWLAIRHTTDESGNWYSGVTIDDLMVNVGEPVTQVNLDLIGQTVIVPPSGGPVIYDALLESSLPNPVPGQAWTMVELPNGTEMGPLMLIPVMVTPGTTGFTGLTLQVPAAAPGGEYLYSAYIGMYPNIVATSDSFTFEKIGTLAGAGGGDWNAEPWTDSERELAGTGNALPAEFSLSEAYPNPFNPTTTLDLTLPQAAEVNVTVYNVTGQRVAVLANGQYAAGRHTLSFDAHGLASGVYFVRAEIPGELSELRKLMLVR